MATLDIFDLAKSKVGALDVNDGVFAAPFRGYLLTEVVHWQRAKRRRGTQSAMTKAEVHGTTMKPFAQKGRGVARQGSLKNPHQIGGGVAFAPKPRDYSYQIPKAKRRAALAVALSKRLSENRLMVLKEFKLESAKTKLAFQALKDMGADNALVVDCNNLVLKRSMKNLPKAKYLEANGLNVYDILHYPMLMMTEDAVKNVQSRLLGEVNE